MTDPTWPGHEPEEPATAPEPAAAPDTAPAAAPAATPEPPIPAEVPWPSEAAEIQARGTSPRRLAVLGFLGAVALGAVIGAAGLGLATGAIGAAAPSPSPVPTEVPTAEATAAPVGNTFGRPDAPVTIEVWADYQCPYCRLEDLLFGGAIDREYVTPGIARVVYRDFAFLGQESIDAAVANRCAGAQEPAAQLRYHDALYTFQQGENEGRFARANLLQVAEIAGVPSQAAFTACLDDPAVAKAVADETIAGRNVGITSTPTLRLRGPGGERVLTGFSQTWPPLRDAIEAVRVAAPASPAPSGSPPPAGSPAPSGSASPSPAPLP
jgi:protein-disulfide isomerase